MVFTALLSNVFQQWTFLCFWAHVLAGWRPSHTNFYSSNCCLKTLIMAAGPHYIGSAWTAQKTPLAAVTPLLCVTQHLPSNGSFSGSTVLALSKCATVCWRHSSYLHLILLRTDSDQVLLTPLDMAADICGAFVFSS
jgi:hypothetical protein